MCRIEIEMSGFGVCSLRSDPGEILAHGRGGEGPSTLFFLTGRILLAWEAVRVEDPDDP